MKRGKGADMKLKLSDAAARANVDKSTLRRAIMSGRLSAERTETGLFLVDASELARWMDARAAESPSPADDAEAEAPREAPQSVMRHAPADFEALALRLEAEARARIAEERAAMLEARIADMKEQRDDARAERDAWRTQAERLALTRQAEPERAAPAHAPDMAPDPIASTRGGDTGQARPSFWRRLFGG